MSEERARKRWSLLKFESSCDGEQITRAKLLRIMSLAFEFNEIYKEDLVKLSAEFRKSFDGRNAITVNVWYENDPISPDLISTFDAYSSGDADRIIQIIESEVA